MSGWTCPHDSPDGCKRTGAKECSPGIENCVLEGKLKAKIYREERNLPPLQEKGASGMTADQIRALYSRN